MSLGPQAWKEPNLGPPASKESFLQKIAADNHVRTGIEPERNIQEKNKADTSIDRCVSPTEK